MLTNKDIAELIDFRRDLHRRPEISGQEVETAKTIIDALKALTPDDIIADLGGHGVAAVFDSGAPGKTVLFRAELDALPIPEETGLAWSSEIAGKGHLCGHDGHMTMLLALGRLLKRDPIPSGRVILMFQPAEEDGSGARCVVADPKYKMLEPDYAFAIHNEPGLPHGYVGTRPGLINCASRGLAVTLKGRTSHAAEPELAITPVHALGEMISDVMCIGQMRDLDKAKGAALDNDFRLVTITHIASGEPTFGITPGEATIYMTLRASSDDAIAEMQEQAEALIMRVAQPAGLSVTTSIHDDFAASINDPEATEIACKAMEALNIPYGDEGVPMRASEDFGVFGWTAKAAMLCLGPGEDHPALHQPDYDFNDDLIPIGASIFDRIARDIISQQ